jgi:hypothetical protein
MSAFQHTLNGLSCCVQVLMYELTGEDKYKQAIDSMVNWMTQPSRFTPKGLLYVSQWGSLRHAANLAHLCFQVSTDTCCIRVHVAGTKRGNLWGMVYKNHVDDLLCRNHCRAM